jgi:hypothetical protein
MKSDMSEPLDFYELDVLRQHRDKPRKESDNEDRRDAQQTLADLGYLTRSNEGVFSVTSKGLKYLRGPK